MKTRPLTGHSLSRSWFVACVLVGLTLPALAGCENEELKTALYTRATELAGNLAEGALATSTAMIGTGQTLALMALDAVFASLQDPPTGPTSPTGG